MILEEETKEKKAEQELSEDGLAADLSQVCVLVTCRLSRGSMVLMCVSVFHFNKKLFFYFFPCSCSDVALSLLRIIYEHDPLVSAGQGLVSSFHFPLPRLGATFHDVTEK